MIDTRTALLGNCARRAATMRASFAVLVVVAVVALHSSYSVRGIDALEVISGDDVEITRVLATRADRSKQQTSAAAASVLPPTQLLLAAAASSTAAENSPFNVDSKRVRTSKRIGGKLKQHRKRRIRRRRNRHHKLSGAALSALVAVEESLASSGSGLQPTFAADNNALAVRNNEATALTALESIVEEVTRAQQEALMPQPMHASSQHLPPADLIVGGSTHAPEAVPGVEGVRMAGGGGNSGGVGIGGGGGSSSATNNPRRMFLTKVFTRMMHTLNITELASETRMGLGSRATCLTCHVIVRLFLSPLYSKDSFSSTLKYICSTFGLQTPRVCNGLIETFQDDLEYIRYNTKLTRDEVCGVIFGLGCARNKLSPKLVWNITIPKYPPGSPPAKPFPAAPFLDGFGPLTADGHAPFDGFDGNVDGFSEAEFNQPLRPSQPTAPNFDLNDDAPDLLFDVHKLPATSPSQLATSSLAAAAAAAASSQPSSHVGASSSAVDVSPKTAANNENSPTDRMRRVSKQTSISVKQEAQVEGTLPAQDMDNRAIKERPRQVPPSTTNVDSRKISSFVHLTDIHIDPHYTEGALAECRETLCCRATSFMAPIKTGGPVDKLRRAGKWGDLGVCDLPVITLKNTLERIRDNHKDAEYWIWTGDISPHDIWNITKAETINDVQQVSRLVRSYAGVPVYPVIGNHEGHPVNNFSPPNIKGKFSMSWLYDAMAEEWRHWLPADAIESLRVAGCYKLKVRPGFRIVAVNTNFCARLNAWSFYDSVDPAKHLRWLANELLEAERDGDKVHIIGHVPPDHRECTQAWLFNYINIVDRFKDTILGQFYGHTHRDEFRIIYSMRNPEEPVGVQYISPSVTPFVDNNPAYRIFHQDQSGYLFNFDTYFFNLTQANKVPPFKPEWKLAYRVQESYNMTQGLTPADWHIFLQRITKDERLFDEYHKNFYRSSDTRYNKVCRKSCREEHLHDLAVRHPFRTEPWTLDPNKKNKGEKNNRTRHRHRHHQTRHRNPKFQLYDLESNTNI